ncbi:MAG: NmrA/HSCARG family protein [Thermoanaerobaculia bacterium]
MSARKIIAVIGATGAQGGGLVRAILDDDGGEFVARAVTRKPDSEKAKELARLGAEVVAADLDDEATLVRAFEGAWGAYCVTNYWEHFSPEREKVQAGNMARAAKKAGVKHVIWSTLEDTRNWVPLDDDRMPTLMQHYKVPHFDAKGESNQIFLDAGVPVTFLVTSFYWDNFIYFGSGPKRGADGKLSLVFPMDDRPLPGIAAEDIGRCAYGVFKGGAEWVGKSVGIAGEHLSGTQMAAALTRGMKEEVVYTPVPPDVYRSFGFPGADDLGNMFQFKRDFNSDFVKARDLSLSRSLNPRLQSFEEWVQRNAHLIPRD